MKSYSINHQMLSRFTEGLARFLLLAFITTNCGRKICESAQHSSLSQSPKAFLFTARRRNSTTIAYQLFEERRVHHVEFCPVWPDPSEEESAFCFFRFRCFPSQDTSKQPYRVVVCMDKRTDQPYGAPCRCVPGLGKACSHVAGLLFAVDHFTLRGFQSLPN